MSPDEKKSPAGGNKPKTGGNTPKPPTRPGGAATQTAQSAKDRSKAQSRSVSAKAPSGKSGTSTGAARTGGNKPKPGARPAAAPQPRRFSGALMAWTAVGLVVVIIGVLVIVKVAGNSNSTANATYTAVTTAPASVVHDVTNIPLSVYDKVGITSQQAVNAPTVINGQPPMTLDGKSPAMLYYGAEYCPYCAAERWPMTAALSRFGTWSNLKITASSHTDVDAETHTFSYYGATFTSPYITFRGIEAVSNIPSGNYYKSLMTPTKEEAKNISTYYNPKFIQGAVAGQVGFPFVNIDNKALISGPSYDPGILSGLSWQQIAGGLDDPSNEVTQAIVATANYMSASICSATKQQPSSVCMSSGVQAAAKALKLG
jgi:hypothetical protein